MIHVLIADDHAVVRRGLKQIIAEQSDMAVVGEAQNADELLRLARTLQWNVIVLDIHMPGRSGLEVLKEIKRAHPKRAVLILSMHPEEQYATRVLRAGAAGYLTKEAAPAELVSAIRKVSRGGRYVSATLAENLAMDLDKDSQKPLHANLSDRELQVMLMIVAGKSVSEIAQALALSAKTVSTYRTRIV